MPTLADQIDRLTNAARSVKSSATSISASTLESGGPFTQAVLDVPLGDLIRDADPSELGLFTLISPTGNPSREADPSGPSEVTRVEVVNATPLRKPPIVRKDTVRPLEQDPEVYAMAALKYIDRYASIRPMPRARSQVTAMLGQLEEIRTNMDMLNEALSRVPSGSAPDDDRPASPKVLIAEEERHIQKLQESIRQMQKRRESLQRKSVIMPPKTSRTPKTLHKIDYQEESFWNTPSLKAHLPQFEDSLLVDERVDVAEMTTSFDSPLMHRTTHRGRASPAVYNDVDASPVDALAVQDIEQDVEVGEETIHGEESRDSRGVGQDASEDATITLSGQPATSLFVSPRSQPASGDTSVSVIEVEPNQDLPTATDVTSSGKRKVRITTDVERIVAKIWSTVGDIIMPGHKYDVSGTTVMKPPRAKATITHLQSISVQTPTPLSPTTSSLSSMSLAPAASGQITPQQVLTAQMLLALLSSPPEFALPLNKVKEILGSKNGPVHPGAMAGLPTRVLYGCVAKKLVKIERGGGEQTVRFDVT
ncbi:hypothetical protein K488DRAFT_88464 [Vararia minispora EC-137]|uniref:Uncharacterized protein n=1 Tax=Vararia minispora EC-137 TaxID=1314806 RepID=A0ACB8QD41_9AGAM|nr:hypothetical protein K488DRAFT_88464 [Vararia minispora EC-137]